MLFALGTGASAASGAALAVAVQQAAGRPLAGAVVMAEAPDTAPRPPVHGAVDQVDMRFEPDVLVVPVGSTVEFPNSDVVAHQVYSFSPTRRFQLPLYRGKPYPPVQFDVDGVVTSAPSFGRTVSVAAGESAQVTIRLQQRLRPARIVGRPHSWDAY